jgi:uncharacterized protein (DUF488 family)
MPHEIWTIGHSTLAFEAFLARLSESAIALVADVRRFPGSRRHPQFSREAFVDGLKRAGVGYRHLGALGGRRSERASDSPNTAWRVEAFNAYADYMNTHEFGAGLRELINCAAAERTAIMCAEAVPWRCHRRLIADALIVRGWKVWDILGPSQVTPHALTEFARVDGDRLTYPGEPLFPGG